MISNPPNNAKTGQISLPSQDYVYDKSAGQGVTVYILVSPLPPKNPNLIRNTDYASNRTMALAQKVK